MKKYISIFSISVLVAAFSFILMNSAVAQSDNVSFDSLGSLATLVYPIAELGNCKDKSDCKIYCDNSVNTAACVSYAEKNNLLSQEDLQITKKFLAAGAKGPGNCNGKKECQAYCENKSNIDECVAYAENNGLMSLVNLQKAKKIQAAIKRGIKFPACTNKKECDAYCEESSHMEECIAFAQEAGFLSEKELQNTKIFFTAIKKGISPLSCRGKDACDAYCAEESHTDECTKFALSTGLITSEEAKLIKGAGGKGPGGCKNKKECDSYCDNAGNQDSCLNFAQKHNLISQEQFDKIKKGGGPGQGNGPGNGAGQGGGRPGGPNQGQGFNPGSGVNGNGNGPGQGNGPGNGAGQGGGRPGGGGGNGR